MTDKKQCSKCKVFQPLERFKEERKQCNLCLESKQRYRERNKETLSQKAKEYYENNKENKQQYQKEYSKEYNQRKIECQYCRCMVSLSRKAKHERTNKHINNVNNPKPPKTEEATKEYKQQTTQEEIRDYIETSSDFEYDINKE